MKLKNKLYLTQFFLILALVIFIWAIYQNLKRHNEHDLDHELETSTNINTLLLKGALEDTYQAFEQRKNLFSFIHRTALNEFRKDEFTSLKDLKNKIVSFFYLRDLDIDLFVIDANYVIIDATYEKDIGLDFKTIHDGKIDLDKASKDNNIHLGSHVAIDYMDSTIKIYSCARVDNDKYLEMAFIDPSIYHKLRTRISNISKSTKNKITIFRIRETSSNEEYYEDIMNTDEISNKKEWIDSLKKFPINTSTDNDIINAKRQNKIIKSNKHLQDNIISMYIPLLNKEKDISLSHNHFILQLDIDISDHVAQWEKSNMIFIFFILISLILMIMLYFFIKDSFYIPITKITQNFEDETKIKDPSLLMKKDEFGILVDKYNTLYTKLQDQIDTNKHLLNENKQFIADMVHQIRTPLSVIMTNSSLIEMKTKDQVSSYLTQINSAINMLSNSYEDLSYIITNDTIAYTPLEINLTDFLHQRIDFFDVIAQANDKTIMTDIENDIHIYMNDIELERLIDNNLSNAVKHSNPKSDINIVLKKNNSEIVLKFISKGEAIKNVSKLFDKNYTESNGAKRSLGLGLNMVKMICEKSCTRYYAHSQDGTNTFTYIFRAQEEESILSHTTERNHKVSNESNMK